MNGQTLSRGTLGERRYDLDWVRIGAFMLLIFYHVGMYYVTWDWHVKSPHASHTIEPLMLLTNPWRLQLLFLISGVATGYLLDRQGMRGFLGQRSVRLLVPLLFGMAVIVPPQSYLQVVEKLGYAGSYVDFLRLYVTGYHGFCQGSDCLILPTWNHLWFVAYLWVYTVVLYVGMRLLPEAPAVLRNFAERRLVGVGVLVWPAAFLVLARFVLAARFPANHALLGDWYNHAQYGAIFLLGFCLAGTASPWVTLERARWGALGIAVLGWAYLCALLGAYGGVARVPSAISMSWQVVYGVEQWSAIVAVLGFARRHLVHDSAARRYLTTAIFPVYILHQTIIVVCAHALQPSNLNPAVEGPLLVLVTAAVSFLGYDLIRRIRWLRPLFGLAVESESKVRPAPKWRPQVATLAPQDIN
jgi:glucan biosynthesis protein C